MPLLLMLPLMQAANVNPSHNISLSSTEKVTISITQSTGDVKLFQENFSKYYTIFAFAKSFLQQMTEAPPEFDEFFKQNFWDLLA